MKKHKVNNIVYFLVLIFLISPILINSQSVSSRFLFKENKGQFNAAVNFKSEIFNGAMFLTKKGILYSFYDKSNLEYGEIDRANFDAIVKCHSVKIEFENSNPSFLIKKRRKSTSYENYYKGTDKSKWAKEVYSFNEVTYENIYDNVDFKIFEYEGSVKYDFIVKPLANVNDISFKYEGQDKLSIEDGALIIETSLQDIIEQKPYAYQIINGEKIEVDCNFVIKENQVFFQFPNQYNTFYELVIDPIIVFSSYVNSTSDNFGFAATYDTNECSFVSGIVFGTGYPTSLGAYDITWAGGSTFPFYADVAISKFTPEGDSLLYSTYLGGTDGEVPHSMVTNDQGELYVYGTTGSSNFPMLSSSYDNSFNGGTGITPNSKSTSFSNGSDIFLVKFNAAGTALLGATFIGGSSNDGLNTVLGLAYNHGDEYRGDIVLDNAGNAYVVSTTNSTNFPVIGGTTSPGGSSSAVVFKFNSTLSGLIWSSYFGGSGNDAGHGIARDAMGNFFITGGTSSTSIGAANNAIAGGIDGYLAKFNSLGVLQTSRYTGTAVYDQSYFIQTDVNDDVFIMGQSLGSMPIFSSGPVYSNAGSHQFVQKYNNALTTLEMGTTIGKNGTSIDFSPTAFNISSCGMIYICGWGGIMNVRAGGSTNGLPTYRAYQGGSSGSDFYIMLLEKDAKALFNATYFGGATGAEHVDGGNSKFDDKGNIYQAVCAGCASSNDYPTTMGSWSDTNGYSNNCNAALFKFKIDTIFSNPTIPFTTICFPDPANFGNLSVGSNAYFWDFGDGNTSNLEFPSHTYSATGQYIVNLIAYDTNGCLDPDTNKLVIDVLGPPILATSPNVTRCPNQPTSLFAYGASSYVWSPSATLNSAVGSNPTATTAVTTTYMVIGTGTCGTDTGYITITVNAVPPVLRTSPDTTICPNDSVRLFAFGAINYNWTPSNSLSNSTIYNPKAAPSSTTTYTVIGSNACGFDTANIVVTTRPINFNTSPDSTLCLGDSMKLRAGSGSSHVWTPAVRILNSNTASPTVFPISSMNYYLAAITNDGCAGNDTVSIMVINPPIPSLTNDLNSCPHQPIVLTATGATSYVWSPPYKISSTSGSTVTSTTDTTTTYYVDFSNICFTQRDSVTITVSNIKAVSSPDDTVCSSDSVNLWAYGGDQYTWYPSANVAEPTNSITKAKSNGATVFYVVVKNGDGCIDTAYTSVVFYPKSFLDAGPNQVLVHGASTNLAATHSAGNFYWNPDFTLFCDTCPNTTVKPEIATDYIANLVDTFGCIITDTVRILMDGSIYIPNSFSPNRDCKNEKFIIYGMDLIEYDIEIYNRWGELVYKSQNINDSWDGTFKGKLVPIGTYVWKLTYLDARLLRTIKYGHVNVLR